MSRNEGVTRQSAAGAVVIDLAGAAPLSEKFWSAVRRQSRHAIDLVPVDTVPGAPSGMWCRMAGTDYLYYEGQTSPFHQAHILLHLAAMVLLSGPSSLTIDPRLVPGLDPQLIRLILGSDAEISAPDEEEAEDLAILAMDRVNRQPSWITARRMPRQLQPLHAALLAAVPEAARPSVQAAPRARLHQVVVEIRDAVLALRPYWDRRVLAVACQQADAAGVTGQDRAAAVEAAVMAAAVRAKAAGAPALDGGGSLEWQHRPGRDLASEAAWLVKVSRAFSRDDPAGERLRSTPVAVLPSALGRE